MNKLLFRTAAAVLALFGLVMALASPSSAQSGARIHLIHGIPNTPVDVEVDGKVIIPNFNFKDTKDLSSFSGQTLKALKVKAAGTQTVAIDAGDLKLPATGNYTAIAHLDASGKPTLTVFANDTSKVDAGKGRLVVRHTAAAPGVDVLAGDKPAFTNIVNGKEAKADLPAGTVKASVVPTGTTSPVVIGPADLPVAEGKALIVYAVGSLDAKTLTVITETIDGLHSSPAKVNTGNSPVSSGGSDNGALIGLIAAGAVALAAAGVGTLRAARARA